MDFSRSNVLNIFIGVIVIFALIIFIEVSNLNLNPDQVNKKVVQVVNIEALKNNIKDKTDKVEPPNTSINLNPVSDFCKSSSSSLKESCAKLTKKNCNSTSCCIMLNGEKCVAGNQDGPTFKTNSGEDITVDYYYYQNKCYGDSCPTN
jgi:hypothetical protein